MVFTSQATYHEMRSAGIQENNSSQSLKRSDVVAINKKNNVRMVGNPHGADRATSMATSRIGNCTDQDGVLLKHQRKTVCNMILTTSMALLSSAAGAALLLIRSIQALP